MATPVPLTVTGIDCIPSVVATVTVADWSPADVGAKCTVTLADEFAPTANDVDGLTLKSGFEVVAITFWLVLPLLFTASVKSLP
jgi:hypothetical protein